jgi:hypothetical protein
MHDVQRAMDEISTIRSQIARSTEFRGFGPTAHAVTACVALLAAGAQAVWVPRPVDQIGGYLAIWLTTAALSIVAIGIETFIRSVRLHGGLAREMLHSAIEQFLPAIAAGGFLTGVLLRFAPESAWMLPGLWQIILSLGVFASVRFLPRPMFAVGVWYLLAGLLCLAVGNGSLALTPWLMGIPFGVGQLLVAIVLYVRIRDADA